MKRKGILVLAGCMLITTVTGCNFLPPKTAVDVVERYQTALEKTENFKVEGDIDLGMSIAVKGEDISLDIPINMELEALTDGKENIYLNMDVSTEIMEKKASTEVEAYMQLDGKDMVAYTSIDGGEWIKSELDNEEMLDLIMGKMNASPFENGTFEKKDDKYFVTLGMEEIVESETFKDVLKDNKELLANIDEDKLLEQLGKMEATYTFDEKCMLEKMEWGDFEFSQEIEESGLVMEVSMELNVELSMKDYGEVDKDTYMLPDDIKKEAVEESEQKESSLSDIFSGSENETEEAIENTVEDAKELESEAPEETTENTKEDNTENTKEDITENTLTSGAYALYDFDGNMLCEVNCPQNFTVTEVSESNITMENANGYVFFVSLYPEVWMEEFMTTGTFTADEEFYSYEDVSIYGDFESSYGTVTILQRDWTMVDLEEYGVDTTYGVLLSKGEYSPYFTVSADDLEEWGVDIETLAREVFK